MEKYQKLIQDALLGVVKTILNQTAKEGLTDDSHFYISFNTKSDGVIIPAFLKERYPEEMTIVLQHQFEDLQVSDNHFSVVLSFNGKPEKLTIPFCSILTFADPSEQFALQFMPALMTKKEPPKKEAPAKIIDLAAIRNKKS